MIRLRVDPADGARFEHPFQGDSLVIGRSSASDLVLADRYLSRRHARLFRRGEEILIEDMGSRNGTLVNGRRSEGPTRVIPGDVIKLSGSSISISGVSRAQLPVDPLEGTVFRRVSDLLTDPGAQAAPEADEASLRRSVDRLQILNEVHQALGRSVALDELLGLILDRAFEHLGTDEGAIYLRRGDGQLSLAASRPQSAAGSYPYSKTLIREVTEKRLAALVLDAQTDVRFAGAQSMVMAGIRSIVAAPLLSSEDAALGMIVLNSKAEVRRFTNQDMELLVSLAAVAALRIENVALAEEAAQRQRMEEELALARRIQMALLPDSLPEVPGYELRATNEPSRGVSGDYYLAVEREGGGEIVLMMADVSGKGIAAALLTATLEALSAGPIEEGRPANEICALLSRLLFARTPPEKYATAVVAVLDPATGRVCYANAGHNPPLVVRSAGAVEALGSTGTPLGLLAESSYGLAEVTLEEGDILLLYTDGITEAENPQEEEFGQDRLEALCGAQASRPATALLEAIDSELQTFVAGEPFADDRTLLALKREGMTGR